MTATLRRFPVRTAAVVAVLGGIGFGLGYLGSWPPVATVMSGSMSPTIKTGDVVVFKRLGRAAGVGDVVKVDVPDSARTRYGYPPVVIHRIVRLNSDGTVTTKGDARKTPDPFTVKRDSLSTHVVFDIPAAGRVVAFLMSPLGLLWIAGGVAMFFVLPLFERRQEAVEAEQATLAAVQAELATISGELARLREQPAEGSPQPAEGSPQPAEGSPQPVVVDSMPRIDWLDLETVDEPSTPEPEPAPVTYTVRRRSGGLLSRFLH
jgi:signal peptidase I